MQITNMHCSGQTVSLIAGDYHTTIVTVGVGPAELTFQGYHLIIPHKPKEMPLAYLGKVLIPWPNRIANGYYRYQGQEHQLSIDERGSKAAIHGLLVWRDWQISELSATGVTLTAFLPPSYGYPFILAPQVVYSFNAHTGLSVEVAGQNIGTVVAPYGVGIHPYLTCNLTSADEYLFQLPANQVYTIDEHANPTTLHHADGPDLNLTQTKKIAATKIDHTFKIVNDLWKVTITHPQQALSVSLCSDQPWVQVYGSERLQRQGLAVEPMSCPSNAFNSDIDLLLLGPGKTHHLFFNIHRQHNQFHQEENEVIVQSCIYITGNIMDFFTLFLPDGIMLETNVVCIVIALMFLCTFAEICAEFGGGLATMPFVTLVLPIRMATPPLVIVDTAAALYATWLSRKETDRRSAMVLTVLSFLGIPIGLYTLSYLPDHFMKVGLGGFLILYSFYSVFIPRLSIYDCSWIAAPVGAMAGALGAVFSTNGPPMVIYDMLRNLGPTAFRGILNAFFTTDSIAVIGGLAASGILAVSVFELALFYIPTMILDSLVGQYVHKRISIRVFRVMVFLLLITSGSMLIKGALGIPAAAALLLPFTLLVILQLAFGKKAAAIRRAGENK